MTSKQEKVRRIYDFISENLYLCLPDIEVDDREFNSTLLFEMLSCLNRGKQMLFGEYGLGKTTSSEHVVSLMYSIPKEVVLAAELRGHPEQTEEKMIARPDLGMLNNGIEKVLWSYFVLNAPKILDEINRLPASKQNIILDGIDRGNWKYLSELLQGGDFALFATCNYEDLGNTPLIEPVLDRFDIATESKRPGLVQMAMIKDIPGAIKQMTSRPDLAEKMLEIYDSKDLTYKEKLAGACGISERFREDVSESTGLELLTSEELSEIESEIANIQMSKEAEMFYLAIISELASCQEYGMKRANEQCKSGCHYTNFACGKTDNGLSVRGALAIAKYAKTLAWLSGSEEVNIEHVEKVLPYITWHRMRLRDSFASEYSPDRRSDPIQLYATKKLAEGIKQRFVEHQPAISNYLLLMAEGKQEEAADSIADRDHPVFKEFARKSWKQ